MKLNLRDHALWLASALILLFAPMSAEAQKALVYCPAVDQSGCTTVKAALTSAFPGGVDMADDGANGTIDLRTADLFQYAVFFVPSLAETDSAAPYARMREQIVADRLKAALIGRRAFWSGTPDQGVLATTRPQKDQLIQNLAAWASADFGTVNAPGLVVLQDNSDVVTQRYSWVQPIVGFQIVADPKLASYSSVRSLTSAGNAILSANGATLAYGNMASFGFQTPSGASGVSLDAVGQTGTSVGGQVVLLTQMGANTGGAVIRTDTDDYPPGTPVIMTGTGFQAGEAVTLTLHEDPLLHADRVHTATADGNGGFIYDGFAPEEHDIDVRFVLTAKGQTSGRQAQTTFTDAQPQGVSLPVSSRTVVAGGTAKYVVNVNVTGNTNACTVTLQLSPALPAGASASYFSNPKTTNAGYIDTLTITTLATTAAGTYSFTLEAQRSLNCQGNGPGPTANVTLVVNPKQSQATVNVINMPPSPQQFGASFTVAANGGSGTGAYSFSATGSCSVVPASGLVTMTSGAGACSVTAIRLGDANFNDSSPSSPATVNATPAIQPAVTLTVPSTATYPTGFTASASGGVAGASVTYSTSSLACSVHQTSGVVTILSTGTCAITATAKSANYADATDTKTTTINPGTQPAVTLTLPATTTFPTGATASAAGGATGATFSYSTLSSTCSVVASSGVVTVTGVGACVITATATATNYADATDTKSMTIGAAATTTVVTVANATFDGAAHGGTATATGPGGLSQSLTVSYVGRNGTTYPLSTTAPTNAGDYTASATYTAAGNYLGSTDSQDFSIGKAAATITVNGFTGPYDGAPHGATGTATGIGGASLVGLNLGTSFTDVPGGTATWTFTDATGNYSDATGSANIVISKASQSITFGALSQKTYGDAPFAVSATASSGLAVTFSVTGNCSIAGSTVTITGAGSCTVTASQTGNGNFNPAVDVPQSFDVAKAKAAITVTGYSGVFDGAAHGATGSASGISGVDLSSLLSLGASFTNVPGGTANWSFAGDANYEAASGTAAITITKADASITVDGYTGVYDGSAHSATGTAKGVGGVTLTGLDLGASFTNVPGGTAAWTFTDATGNYNNASGTAAIVISKADAAVTVSGYSGVYDGNPHGATGSAKGVLNEALTGLDLGDSFTNVPGGTASWTYTDATGNYKNASGTATITISKAEPTVTVDGYTGTYDGEAHGATGSAKGVKGETLAGLNLGASFTNVPGGTATWTYTDATGNYNNATGTAAIVLAKANATIAVDGYTGVYDAAPHGATGTAAGAGGVSLAGLDLGAKFTNVPGGTASWTFTDLTGNYNNAAGTVPIVITQATPTVTAVGGSFTFDAIAHPGSGSAAGVSAADLGAVTLSYTKSGAPFAGPPVDAGSYEVTAHYAGSTNYTAGTSAPAAIEIAKANASITVNGFTGMYDGDEHGATGSATGVRGAVLTGLNLGAKFTNVPGGTASWVFTDVTGNYNDASGTAAITITKANATVSVTGYSSVYDGAAHGATGTAKGVKGESLTGLNLGATFMNVPGGTATWQYIDATGNYNDATGAAPIVITQATPVVTAVGGSFTYDATEHPGSGSAAGVGAADLGAVTLSYTKSGAPFGGPPIDAGSYEVTAHYAGSTNYTAGASGAVAIEIGKATATITVNGYTGVYDGEAHGATGSATGVGGVSLTGLALGANFTNVPGGTANWVFTDVTGNYKDASGSAAIVITKADPTVTVDGYTGVYDGNSHGASGTAKGVKGETLSGLNLGATFSNVPGGSAAWTFTDVTGNYNNANGTAPITITKANAAVTVTGYTGVFDGAAHGATGTATGVKGESLTGLNLGASFTNVPGGTANWVFTDVTGNYNDATGSAAIVLSKANASITVDGYTGVYDGDPHGATGTAKGVGGASLGGLTLGASFTNVPGGTATWTFTDVTGNYNDATGTAAIVITKANATVNVDGYTGVYDANAHGATGTAKGVKNEALAGLNLGASFTDAPGGMANWAFTDATGNYNNSNGTTPIVIGKATPTVLATGGTFTYNGSPKAGSGSASGVGSVNLTPVTLSYAGVAPTVYGPSSQAPTNAGAYTVTASYAGSMNYLEKASTPATLTINKATIAAPILTDLVKGYNSNALRPTVTIAPASVQVTLEFKQDGAVKGSTAGVVPVGVYNVLATITDPNYTGPSSDALFVIYDPSAGFVTGGGWIDSPPNSYTADMNLTGKANFGFVSKYQKGANVPTGNTEFQFKEGNLNFKSTNFQWLVIQGTSQAQFKGTGTINGAGNYNFMVTVVDGDASGAKKPDTFRIKITQGADVVYDNKMTSPETSFDGTVIGGGSIQIQAK